MTRESEQAVSLAIPMAPQTVFALLENERRRRVLLSLSRVADEITVGQLAVEIAAIENEIDPNKIGSNERTSVYIALIQSHLNTLDDAGAIDYRERSKVVRPTAATEPLAEYIRRLQTACYRPDQEDSL